MSSSVTHLRRVHGEEGEPTDGTGPVCFQPGFKAVLVEEMTAKEETKRKGKDEG